MRKYAVNEQTLDNIDSEEKAYFLGFFFADGHNNTNGGRLQIDLNEKDLAILERFKSLFRSEHPLRRNAKRNSIAWAIYSRKLSNRLYELGCSSKKTFSLKFPEWVPEVLMHHFIRGYNDGDGCFHEKGKRVVNKIIGTDAFIAHLADKIGASCHVNARIGPHWATKGISVLTVKGAQQVKRVVVYIYQDATIYLERKKQIAEIILNRPVVLARKLNEVDVLEIKELLLAGRSGQSIARCFNVSRSEINKIALGKAWGETSGLTPTNNLASEYGRRSTLKTGDVLNIVNLLNKGVGVSEIAKQYNVGHQAISKIKLGQRWSHLTGFKII